MLPEKEDSERGRREGENDAKIRSVVKDTGLVTKQKLQTWVLVQAC